MTMDRKRRGRRTGGLWRWRAGASKEMWPLHAFTGDRYHVACSIAGAQAAEEKLVAEIEERREILRAMTGNAAVAKPPKQAVPSVQPGAEDRKRESA